jgi:hypothetical protein
MLFGIDRGRLAGGADDDQAIGALIDMPIDQGPETRHIQSPIGQHGGNECNKAASKHGDQDSIKKMILAETSQTGRPPSTHPLAPT